MKEILGRVEHAGRLAKQAADDRAGDLSVGTFPAADVRILRPCEQRHSEGAVKVSVISAPTAPDVVNDPWSRKVTLSAKK